MMWCVGGKGEIGGNVSHKRAVAPKKPINRASRAITSCNSYSPHRVTLGESALIAPGQGKRGDLIPFHLTEESRKLGLTVLDSSGRK